MRGLFQTMVVIILKISSTGWVLANFNFKTETNELFPKDFVDH